MKKNGFTLVELLGTLVLVAVIALITVPGVNRVIKKSKNAITEDQKKIIERAAEDWFLEKGDMLDADSNDMIITFDTLKKDGYLQDKDIVNPSNNKTLTGCVAVTYNEDFNQYSFSFTQECEVSQH